MTAKKALILVARVVVSVGMLAFLVWKINDSKNGHGHDRILPPFTGTTVAWLALALALTFLSVVVSSLRWRAVLEALEVDHVPPLTRLVSLYLAGLFVGNVLPSTIGGDVLRVSRLSHDLGSDTPASFASVVLERLTGWLVLPVLTLAGFTINRGFLREHHSRTVALLIACGTLALLAIVSYLLVHPRIGGRLGSSEGWRRFAGAVHYGSDHLRRHPARGLRVVAWGFLYQLILVTAAYSAARTLSAEAIGYTAMLTYFPVVLIAQVLPISISGLGVREGLFVLFLHPLGVPNGKSVALGILIYLLTLGVSLFGAPAFALGAKGGQRHSSPPSPEASTART
ncbi:MAG TPA: lysylphosphatidylglycerol synthase transmembrane domain-containing protein [Acidimicrobiales bacterium]|jgi:uncharacterized membrane protein YbhN (UPF0104 family)|nr:lysylphosphatidylglycerol synthase transmembrane domain-containing protein [Acidimicrobiales bacterium]